uniref:Uncharacterized protein n=1 Tax=Gorilla gorilla gorilla TaxID=9595 RepID=A0A2I2Z928_GORGO
VCLSVRPLGLRQLKIPALTVAKGTETIPAQHPARCHTGLAGHTPASAVQVREPCELGLDLNHLLLEWPWLFHQHLLTCTPESSVSRMWVCALIMIT